MERARWVHVGALTRADFPPDVLATLARDRRLALDAQGLVRAAKPGPVAPDGDFDETVLRHITVLKVAEDEAEAFGGVERLLTLGVPEVLLTQGSLGAELLADGRRERVPVRRVEGDVDPTGRRRRLPRRVRLGARLRAPADVGGAPRGVDDGAHARARET